MSFLFCIHFLYIIREVIEEWDLSSKVTTVSADGAFNIKKV